MWSDMCQYARHVRQVPIFRVSSSRAGGFGHRTLVAFGDVIVDFLSHVRPVIPFLQRDSYPISRRVSHAVVEGGNQRLSELTGHVGNPMIVLRLARLTESSDAIQHSVALEYSLDNFEGFSWVTLRRRDCTLLVMGAT
eukprot:scaffold21204_cov36-Phaeocystis_antarctica.AAC.2